LGTGELEVGELEIGELENSDYHSLKDVLEELERLVEQRDVDGVREWLM